MAYCTSTQVQEEFKDLTFGSGTVISSTRVSRFCDEASAYIDGKIGLLYNTPVDPTASPNATLILQHIAVALVARRLKPILGVKTNAPDDSQQARGPVEIDPEKMLSDIVGNKVLLNDAVRRSTDDGVSSFSNKNSVPHVFDICKKQW